MYIIINTFYNKENSHDYTLYLDKEITQEYTKIRLKSVYIEHDRDVSKIFYFPTYYPLFITCNLLDREDNLINKEPSNILAIINYTDKISKFMFTKFNIEKKISCHTNKIRLELINMKGEIVNSVGMFYIIYEIELI